MQLLDLRNSGRASNQDNVVDRAFVHLGIPHCLLDRLQSSLEQIGTELLKPRPCDGGVEINTFKHRVNLDICLSRGRQCTLSPLACCAQTAKCSLVALHVLLVLPLELVDKVVHETVVEVLPTQVSVTGSGLNLEYALLNGKDGHVKSAATQIKDQDITLSRSLLLVQPIGDGGSGGLVDYSKHIHARNYSSILGSLALRVVEVSRHSNDRILHLRAKVCFRCLLHLGENHGRDLLRGELLGLVLVLHLQLGLGGIINYSEGPVLHIGLDGGILELSSDQALGIKDRVGGVDRHLVLGGVSYQPLGVSEGHVGGGGPIAP